MSTNNPYTENLCHEMKAYKVGVSKQSAEKELPSQSDNLNVRKAF